MDLNAIEKWDIDGTVHQVGIRNIYVNEKGNLVIETTAEMGNTSKGTINIESMKNIQLKPGGKGDVRIMTDHTDNLGQATLHVYDGSQTVPGSKDDIPARLKLNITDLEIDTKGSLDRVSGAKVAADGTEISVKNSGTYVKARWKAPIYGVTRGELVTSETGKVDYPTQADDSKDIINDAAPITWNDVINAVKYLKAQGNI